MVYLYCWMIHGHGTAHITMSSSLGHRNRPSLCGRINPNPSGWDMMDVRIDQEHTVCAGCLIEYARVTIPIGAKLAGLQVSL
jgi:hypothetical protein